jgi:hypothetical protein
MRDEIGRFRDDEKGGVLGEENRFGAHDEDLSFD